MKATGRISELVYEGQLIRTDKQGKVCLTDMWVACGRPDHKDPGQFGRLPVTKALAKTLAPNMCKSHVWKTKSGNNGGTWAVRNIAISYAQYLCPQFHAWANQAIIERLEEEANPELAYERGRKRAVSGWEREGRSPRWIDNRIKGMEARHRFTDTLRDHGVSKPFEYGICTDAIYKGAIGGTAKEEKARRNLRKNDSLRDNFSMVELGSVLLSESIAEEHIETENLYGVNECVVACTISSESVKLALSASRQKLAKSIANRPAKQIAS